MFRWTDDMIRYMADAGRQTDFHRRLTAELLPYFDKAALLGNRGWLMELAELRS